ncbi:hypothetical protein [Patiriisocius sp. Uisw_017]|jgi:hypothetical protein|uniref:hypothetical protein n=1 Tax=Patiriisocius sp. Uisw_017 TaxID=3230968 RepID=UPI0039EC545F
MIIEITHQEDKSIHKFEVMDENKLTNEEISNICNSINVKVIFINGKYYEN